MVGRVLEAVAAVAEIGAIVWLWRRLEKTRALAVNLAIQSASHDEELEDLGEDMDGVMDFCEGLLGNLEANDSMVGKEIDQ